MARLPNMPQHPLHYALSHGAWRMVVAITRLIEKGVCAMCEGSPRPLLPHILERQRGPLMNCFLEPVRTRGITDPAEIVKYVIASLRQDLQRRGRWNHDANLRPLRETLRPCSGIRARH
jgi:hypothetical protein